MEAFVFDVLRRRLGHSFLISSLLMAIGSGAAFAEDVRAARVKPQPVYPEIARRMHLTGVVKIEVTISPSGSVTQKKLVGGNPVLARSCMDALSGWRFEPGQHEDKQIVEFRFSGN
jgi:TonB family protein